MSFAKFDPWAALAEIREVRGMTPQLSQPCRSPVAAPAAEIAVLRQVLRPAVATVAAVAAPGAEKPEPAPARSWTADDWREYFEERLAAAMIDGEQPEAQARAIAYECCIVMWLSLNPTVSDPSRCCYCGESGHREVLMPFGSAPSAWLHHRCWRPWHHARRERAAAALVEMVHGGSALKRP